MIAAYQTAVVAEIERFGGHVAKFLGDGDPRLFRLAAGAGGRHRAGGPGRARRGAGRGAPACAGRRAPWRPGSASAPASSSSAICSGEGAAREEAIVGETPNLAARLQAVGRPGRGRDRRERRGG